MFSTHPQLEGPRWTCSCSECPRCFCWSRSGSRGTTGTTRWAHSPWHKGLHKPPPRDGEALSRGDVELLHLEQMKQDRHGGRHSLVQHPQPAPNRLTWCHTSTCPRRNLLQNSEASLQSVIPEQLSWKFIQESKEKKGVSSSVCGILDAVHSMKQVSERNEIISSIESCNISTEFMIIAPYFLAISTYRTYFPQYKLCRSPKKSDFFFL